jgi:small-conductance mechanosensitive channel
MNWIHTVIGDHDVLGNTVAEWTMAGVIVVCTFFALFVLREVLKSALTRLAKKSPSDVHGFLIRVVSGTYTAILLIVALHIGAVNLELIPELRKILKITLALSVLIQLLLWGNQLIEFLALRVVKTRESRLGASDPTIQTIMPILRLIGRLMLFAVLLLLTLDNLGVNISALLTGLGIGGVAVALAVQNVLGDLFASLSIAIDRPFEVGDAITVNQQGGTVERIGLRTTRLRSFNGEELVFPNNMLLSAQIQNMRRMKERRATFNLGVTYDTTADQIDRIPEILEKIISTQPGLRFERAGFHSFGDSALLFEVIYWTESRDISAHRELQHKINSQILRRFNQEGISFAYPTQTLYVRQD